MILAEIFLLALGLCADTFAVSAALGASISGRRRKSGPSLKAALLAASFFALSQALFPLVGFAVGAVARSLVASVDHWIAFAVLSFIGARMILGALGKHEKIAYDATLSGLAVLAVATSMDALAVGVTFAFTDAPLFLAVAVIGAVTFAVAFLGVLAGRRVAEKFGSAAEVAGGFVLVAIGLRILLSHLGAV